MDVEAFIALQPAFHRGVFVSGIVVHDQMDLLVLGGLVFKQAQEAQPFLVAVLGHAGSDHRAVERVERGEQGGCAVAFVVVGHGPAASLFQGQAGLGAVEGLNL